MPHSPNEKLKILERQQQVAGLWRRGCSYWEIARDLDISRRTVCFDLEAIRDAYLATIRGEREVLIFREIARLELIESEALAAWERSKLDAQVKTAKVIVPPDKIDKKGKVIPGKPRTETSKREEGQCGDPRFLAEMRACSKQRSELLGLLTHRVEITGAAGGPVLVEITDAERDAIRERLYSRLGLRPGSPAGERPADTN